MEQEMRNKDRRCHGRGMVLVVLLLLFLAVGSGIAETTGQEDGSVTAITPSAEANPTEAAPADEPEEQLKATVTSMTGASVQYSVDGGQSWQAVSKDLQLGKDAIVRTGFASGCEISFQGNTILQVEALSCVRVAEYIGSSTSHKVQANLQYGALRCGVAKGRIKSDTTISTPVATLGIRGTVTHVEFDRGTSQCKLGVLKDGPADARTWRGSYRLAEGMKTDSTLSRHLKTAIMARTVFVTGNQAIGDLTVVESEGIIHAGAGVELPIDDPRNAKLRERLLGLDDTSGSDECPGGECDIGPSH